MLLPDATRCWGGAFTISVMNFSKRGQASGTSSISACPLERFAMTAPFEASKLKLERAAEHLQEFDREAIAYLNSKPCAIVVEAFRGLEQSGEQSWNARIRRPMPTKFSVLIGDFVHNLRTALDLLVCDLVTINGGSAGDVYFPFCATAAELPHMIRRRKIHRAGPDVVAYIESLKPYKGGNVALRAIHDLDLIDKHRALLPTLSGVSLPLGKLFGTNLPDAVGNWQCIIVQDGQMIIGTADYLKIPLGTELPARFFLVLDFGPGIGFRPVVKRLHELAREADGIFKALTSLRPGAKFPVVGPQGGGSPATPPNRPVTPPKGGP
jgi:hypothetical protein